MKLPRTEEEVRYARAQGRVIHQTRVALGLTRKEIAGDSGIPVQAIYRIEMGDRTLSTYDLERLARALGVETAELWPGHEPEPIVETMLSLASFTAVAGALA